jgi:hypothetical protein
MTDRNIGLAGMIVGIIGLVFTYYTSSDESRFLALRNTALVAFGAVCTIIPILFLKRFRARIADEDRRLRNAEAQTKEAQRELAEFRNACEPMHSIAHCLRDSFSRLLEQPRPIAEDMLVAMQQGALTVVCGVMARLLSGIANCELHVCISLCKRPKQTTSQNQASDDHPKIVCFPYAHSRYQFSLTETGMEFEVGPSNTRFNFVNLPNNNNLCYFYSGDLESLYDEKKYLDADPQWRQRYLSCLVVPIRLLPPVGTQCLQLIGFVKVETMLKGRLGESFHRDLVSGFADSIALFLVAGATLGPKKPDGTQSQKGDPEHGSEDQKGVTQVIA